MSGSRCPDHPYYIILQYINQYTAIILTFAWRILSGYNNHMQKRGGRSSLAGFTIVELLIVIVVIGILAAVVIVAYMGIQERAREAKIQADFNEIRKAVTIIHTNGSTLGEIVGDYWTGGSCMTKPDGTDLAALSHSDPCWADYLDALNKLSIASSLNVRNIIDPWGRPYYIDENEGEIVGCGADLLGVFPKPFVSFSGTDWTNLPTLCT
jgi:prepilin-type N-terminal cleavage/methylation domain-containing protein